MKKITIGLLLFIFFTIPANSQFRQYTGHKTLKAAIGIIVENMRPDYIDRYWNKFGDDGFRKLYSGGITCTNFIMPLHAQNYASGMATLFTGVYPCKHGIIDRQWYDRAKKEEINCVADKNFSTIGSDSKAGSVSPLQLRGSTIGDQLKLSTNGKSHVFSIALNNASSVLSGGFSADAAYWFDEVSGRMVSGSFYLNHLPDWVSNFNKSNNARTFISRNWAILKTMSEYSESLPDNNPLEKGYGQGLNVFPHNIGNLVKEAGSYAPLKTTPFSNSIIRDFAIELLDNEQIGTDDFTDLVTVVFSSMDDENGSFGPASVEMEDLYLRLDQEIAEIISYAEKKYGLENMLIFLTSNTSASYQPAYLKEKLRIPAGNFYPENAVALLSSFLNINYGDLQWIEYFNDQQLYLNHQLIEINKVDLAGIREKAAGFLSQFEGIHKVVTADQLEKEGISDISLNFFRNGYVPGRSGDILFDLNEGWQPAWKVKRVNYTDQVRLPLVFYGDGLPHKTINTPYDATDLVPTLSEILNIQQPDKCRGKIIDAF
jgi:hypothetical protein